MNIFSLKHKSFELVVILSFLIAGLALYGWSINAPFYFDDHYNILRNNFIHDLKFFFQYFTDPLTHNVIPENAPYRPFTTTIYGLLWAIGDGSTVPFRLYKIILHVLGAWFIFKIFQKIFLDQLVAPHLTYFAWFGVFVFLIHPANAETLNYISSTSTLQCSVFYLAAFYFSLRDKCFLMALFFAGALLTKEEGATLPAAIFIYGIVFGQIRGRIKAILIAVGVLGAYLLLYLNMPQTVNFSNIDRWTYLITQFRAWTQYLIWIFWPFGFAIEHKGFGFSSSFWDYRVLLSFCLHFAIINVSMFFVIRKKNTLSPAWKALCFGLLWFYLAMSPTSSVFALFEPINEHRYYLSYAIFIPALVLFAGSFYQPKRQSAWAGGAIVVTLLLSILTLQQVQIWRTAIGVWSNAVEKDPENGKAFLNLGVAQLALAQYDAAIGNFSKCLELVPRYNFCGLNMAIAFAAKGDLQQADQYFRFSYEIDPKFVLTLGYYGDYLVRYRKDYTGGLKLLKECEAAARGSLALCYESQPMALRALKRFDEALVVAQEVYRREPSYKNHFEIGLVLVDMNRVDEAYNIFSEINRTNPNDTQSIHNMAWLDMQRGRWLQSKELWLKKINLAPDDKAAWQNLEIVAQKLNDAVLLEQARAKLIQ